MFNYKTNLIATAQSFYLSTPLAVFHLSSTPVEGWSGWAFQQRPQALERRPGVVALAQRSNAHPMDGPNAHGAHGGRSKHLAKRKTARHGAVGGGHQGRRRSERRKKTSFSEVRQMMMPSVARAGTERGAAVQGPLSDDSTVLVVARTPDASTEVIGGQFEPMGSIMRDSNHKYCSFV